MGGAPPAVALEMSRTSSLTLEKESQPPRMHGKVVPQQVVLHEQRPQPALHLVLDVHACNMLEPQTLFFCQTARETR